MAVFVGDNGPNNIVANTLSTATNHFYGLGGDDRLVGGPGADVFLAGPGNDWLEGGHGADVYHYIAGFQSIYIDEYESSLANGPTNNSADSLRLFTRAGIDDPEGRMRNEDFGLEFVRDAFFVMPGQTAQSPFGANFIETDVLIHTDTGVIHIYDQYGGMNSPDNQQTTDGIELINYIFTNFFGSEIILTFQISSEYDVFSGTQIGDNRSEFFFGARGPDTIFGGGGDDLIFTGDGDDAVFGGAGVDHIVASAGTNTLDGGSSGDVYYWNGAYTAFNFVRESQNSDDDELVANFAVEDLGEARLAVASPGTGDGPVLRLELHRRDPASPDRFTGTFEIERQIDPQTSARGIEYLRFAGVHYVTQDEFSADGVGAPTANHNANDFIVATPEFSGRMRGFDGDDAIFGAGGRDRLFGGAGDDLLVGGGGNDTLFGGAGDDILRGGPGADVLNGGGGSNTADYRFGAPGVFVNLTNGRAEGGQAEGDLLRNIQNLVGGAGDDTLIGDTTRNTLTGGHGDDLLRGRDGRDELRGGAGQDRIYGDNGADEIWGGQGADAINGGRGADRIRGDQGADVIVGGPGNDILWGGGGRDTFVFGPDSGDDQVRDFSPGRDKLDMSRAASGLADLTLSDTADGLLIGHSGGSVLLRGVTQSDLRLQDVEF